MKAMEDQKKQEQQDDKDLKKKMIHLASVM